MEVSSHLTPSLVPSGMSRSCKTPNRDLGDRQSLDLVPNFWLLMTVFNNLTLSLGSQAFNGCVLPSDTISSFIRNVHVLLDSRMRLWGQMESSQSYEGQILMKPSWKLPIDVPSNLSGPPRLQEKTWRTGWVLTWYWSSDLDKTHFLN